MTTTSVAPDAEPPVEQVPEPPVIVKPPAPPRLLWRVVVRTGGQGKMDPSRPSRPLAWHMASCTGSEDPEAHCPEGRRLLTNGDDPDGHCLLNGVCQRCEAHK
jgi:hypothetical protein